MNLVELKKEISQYQYFEDTEIINITLATLLANRLKLGEKIWLIIIGPSSGGKSQILRPMALTDPKFLYRVDDLTENTFLSGMNLGSGKGEASLLKRIGDHGMLVMSDLTVLFSKSKESGTAILSQFRMLYDGEMVKHVGTKGKAVSWKGYLGVLAGSTPSIYSNFEEYSDMGERFIYYRLKDYSPEMATKLSLERKLFGAELDTKLAEYYNDYIKDVLVSKEKEVEIALSQAVHDRIIQIAILAEKIRTSVHTNRFENVMDKIPVTAYPMRVALQLISLAKGLALIRHHEDSTYELNEADLLSLEWCGYSLANEEKRACLKVLAKIKFGDYVRTTTVADEVGLSTDIIRRVLQNLAATGVVVRSGDGEALSWRIKREGDYRIIRRVERIEEVIVHVERETTEEESSESHESVELDFYNLVPKDF
jgi:hypothetical protein